MINLNLLPWRVDARKKENKLYYIQVSISAVVGALVLLAFFGFLTLGLYREQNLNAVLEIEKEKLNAPLTILHTLSEDKKRLDVHVALLKTLAQDRILVLRLLDTLPRVLPAFVSLKKIAKKNAEIVLEGYAHTNAGIALLMKNLATEKNDVQFSNLHLAAITRDRKDAHLRFKITLTLMGEHDNAAVLE